MDGLSRIDIDLAVSEGVIDRESADRLLAFATTRKMDSADDESFRLLTGFNDIFVTIGLGLFLGALYWLVLGFNTWIASAIVAVAAWLLAEIFTRRRRMALPSIALLAIFVGMVFWLTAGLVEGLASNETNGPLPFLVAGIVAAIGAIAHWQRFRVPITIAAGFAAIATSAAALASSVFPSLTKDFPITIFLPLGLAAFALAMSYDISDRQRRTRRTDIAFWLHLLAAPLIVHSVVWNITSPSSLKMLDAIIIFGMFVALSFVAIVVDRRALLVSSLSYLIYAAWTLISVTRWETNAWAIAILGVGGLVLLLSVAWRPMRAAVLRMLPSSIANLVPVAA
jgi:hypothetical protein